MKIIKGKIKNVSKKIIAGTLGTVIIITTPITLTGCSTVKSINYVKNEQGDGQCISGTVDYEILKQCDFYKIFNFISKKEYYTILYKEWLFGNYYDIFNNNKMYIKKFDGEKISSVESYLNSVDMVKDKYTEEELRDILNKFILEQEKNKQLVKGK